MCRFSSDLSFVSIEKKLLPIVTRRSAVSLQYFVFWRIVLRRLYRFRCIKFFRVARRHNTCICFCPEIAGKLLICCTLMEIALKFYLDSWRSTPGRECGCVSLYRFGNLTKRLWNIIGGYLIIIWKGTSDMLCCCVDDLPGNCNLESTKKCSLPHNVSVQRREEWGKSARDCKW